MARSVTGERPAPRHDLANSFPQIGAADSRGARQRKFDIRLAYLHDAARIVSRLTALHENGFVAIAFAPGHPLRSDPPDQRVEPEQRLDAHVQGGGQIVAITDVT